MLFTGRVTSDAEVKEFLDEKKVTNFTVALNKRWKDKEGNQKEKTAFVDCAYWANSGVAEYLTKGTIVEVTGWMEAHAWTSGDNEAKAGLTCTVENLKLFGNPVTKGDAQASKPKAKTDKPKEKQNDAPTGKVVPADMNEDDLPF